MATFTPARLVGPLALSTSPTDLFTATAPTLIRQFICANVTGSTATVRVNLVPNGGSPDGTNQLLPDVTVPPHDVVTLDCFQVMAAGDRLNGDCATGTAIVLTASGVVIT